MNFIHGLLIGIAVSAIACLIWLKMGGCRCKGTKEKTVYMAENEVKKQENIAKAEVFIAGKAEVTNNDIQNFLGISDATATRYLDELEKRGKVVQIGKVGYQVKYKVKYKVNNS